MAASRPDEKELEALFAAHLRARGLKVTRERLEVLRRLWQCGSHVDAQEILAGIVASGKRMSMATIYRTLALLVECGLVRKSRLAGNYCVYELAVGEEHDHMVCKRCGRVVEFHDPELRRLQRELCRRHGFQPLAISCHIVGLCSSCREEEE